MEANFVKMLFSKKGAFMIESILYFIGYFIGYAAVNLFLFFLLYKITTFFRRQFRNSINSLENKTHTNSSKVMVLKSISFGLAFLISGFFCVVFFLGNISLGIEKIAKKIKDNSNVVTLSSIQLFEKSTDPAQLYKAGLAYLMGYKVKSNPVKAKKLFSLAAEKGDANAQAYMGIMCQNGLGGPTDIQMAKTFYLAAAKQENELALFGLGSLYTTTGSSQSEISQGIKYLEKIAQKNNENDVNKKDINIKAQHLLATIYEGNALVAQDLAKAKKYYAMAAKQNDAEAQCSLGILNSKEKNYDEAKKWLELSADQKFVRAYTALANLYFYGYGVKKDYTQAKKLYEEAAKAQDLEALTALGMMYATGLGIEQNIELAKEYLDKPAKIDPNIKYLLVTLNETHNIDKQNRALSILKTLLERQR